MRLINGLKTPVYPAPSLTAVLWTSEVMARVP
jgi:hypothetical protein